MREMKASGVAWIGEIPDKWNVNRLKSKVQTHFGGCWGEDIKNDGNDRLCIRIADFEFSNQSIKNTASTLRNYTEAQIEKCTLHDGDLIVEKSGGGDKTPVGRVVIYNKDQFAGSALFANFSECVRLTNDVCKKYIAYHLKTLYYSFDMHYYFNQTTGLQNLDLPVYLNAEICLPSTHEQDIIATFLDAECSKVDALIANQEAQIEKLKAYKQSLITEVVTKGLDPNVPMKASGFTWISTMPSNWQLMKIKQVSILKTGSTPPSEHSEYFNGDINWYTPGDFHSNVISKSARSITMKAQEDLGIIPFPKESTLLIGIGGTAGKVSYISKSGYSNQQITALIPQKIYPKFLLYYMLSIQKYMKDNAQYTTLPIINNQYLGAISILVPPVNVQEDIVKYLDDKCAKVDSLIEIKQQKIEKLNQYKKSLIYEYVTGKKEVV